MYISFNYKKSLTGLVGKTIIGAMILNSIIKTWLSHIMVYWQFRISTAINHNLLFEILSNIA